MKGYSLKNNETKLAVKRIDKTYWDMTPEEKMAFVMGIFQQFSPNEEVRNAEGKNKK